MTDERSKPIRVRKSLLDLAHQAEHKWMVDLVIDGVCGDGDYLTTALLVHCARFHGLTAEGTRNVGALASVMRFHELAHGRDDVLGIEDRTIWPRESREGPLGPRRTNGRVI